MIVVKIFHFVYAKSDVEVEYEAFWRLAPRPQQISTHLSMITTQQQGIHSICRAEEHTASELSARGAIKARRKENVPAQTESWLEDPILDLVP